MSTKDEESQEDGPVQDPSSPRPATFQGKLQLQDFMHTPPSTSPRRSTRLSQPPPPRSSSTSTSPSRTPIRKDEKTKKRKRPATGYAPPSTYSHLPHLPDAILPNLIILFIGLNPGISTAQSGHAYAHPSNLFWKLLYSSGITPRLVRAEEDRGLPEEYALGLTNIVSRPSRNGGELKKSELDEGVSALEEKTRQFRPECVCIVGKGIWESIWRVRHGRPVGKDFKYGWQDDGENMGVDEGWEGARVFVATSTSGLAATLRPEEKERIWAELGEWTMKRRAEREAKAP